ncbi:MAG: hypothetical protein GY757_14430, partial [bacterium]|nr:hypothetical protein [bacterium]
MNTKNKTSRRSLKYLMVAFALIITLNAFIIRYPVDFILPLFKALLLMGVILVYGFLLLLFFKIEKIELVDVCASGLIVTTLFFYAASILKLLVPLTFIVFFAVPLLLCGLFYFIRVRGGVRGLDGDRDILKIASGTLGAFFKRPAVEYLIFLVPLIYASLPSTFFDTLVYHLGIPNLYIQHQGFVATPQFMYANTGIYYEVALIPAVYAGDMVPRLFHYLVGVIFFLSVIDFAERYFDLTKRTLLLVLILSMPITIFLLTTVKNDLL